MPTAAILTLGCKLNLADSDQIVRGLTASGYQVIDTLCEADAVVINTCSVTHVADRKSRRLIRSARRLNPNATIAVTGCYPRSAGAEAMAALGADLVIGTNAVEKQRLFAYLKLSAPTDGGRSALSTEHAGEKRSVQHSVLSPQAHHTRAFIKAQEGCNDVCAFCIVPRTRGREVSCSIDKVIADIRAAEAEGVLEVVITGTQLGAWGRDFDPPLKPHQLIAAILERSDIPRIRFSSLQPQDISPELLALWSDPRLMPHFHLALQSGSDSVLGRMRRRYSADDFRAAAARIRTSVGNIADVGITTDVIAAFPGETSEEFAETLSFCAEIGFSRIHAFPYSPRSQTAAARMPSQIPHEEKRARMSDLLALAESSALDFRLAQRGTTAAVLWERERTIDGAPHLHGHTGNYTDVYSAESDLAGRITAVTLGSVLGDGLAALSPQSRSLATEAAAAAGTAR